MLTDSQEKIRVALQKNPQLIMPIIQNPMLRSLIQTQLGEAGLSFLNEILNEETLQQILADSTHPFTVHLVCYAEWTYKQVTTQTSEAIETTERYAGPSSHTDASESGADKGFTLVFTSNQSFFGGQSSSPQKMTAAIAKTASPADVKNRTMSS